MKKWQISALAAAGMLVAPLAGTGVKQAHAGAAPMYAEGTDSSEILLLDETTRVEVEREKLEFRAEAYPTYGLTDYTGSVCAEYTLFNPTDTDETLHLALPLGKASYSYGGDSILPDGSYSPPFYGIALNGEAVEGRLRHSYVYGDKAEPTVENLLGVSDFFTAETPVYGYRCTVQMPENFESGRNYRAAVFLTYNEQETKIFSSDLYSSLYENAYEKLLFYVNGADRGSVVFYAAGEQPQIASACLYGEDEETVAEGATVNVALETTTAFGDYAAAQARYESVSGEDWLRAYGNYLDGVSGYAYGVDYTDLYRWAEYEITVPAGGRVTHTVQTTLLPTMRGSRYYYRHYFSPVRQWASFGTLEVLLYATDEPIYSSFAFTKEDDCYTFSHTGYVMGDLSIELGAPYEEGDGFIGGCASGDLQTAFLIIGILAVAGGASALIAVKVHKKRVRELKARAEDKAPPKNEE